MNSTSDMCLTLGPLEDFNYIGNECQNLNAFLCNIPKLEESCPNHLTAVKSEKSKLLQFVMDVLNYTRFDQSQNSSECPPYYEEFGDSCLAHFPFLKLTWAEANEFCFATSGGHLATVSNENFFILMDYSERKNLRSNIWLGGHYKNLTWKWADFKPIGYREFFWSLTLVYIF